MLRAASRAFLLALHLIALGALTGCEGWLVQDPDLVTPTATPTPPVTGTAAIAYAESITPSTPTVTPTVTLTPIASATLPIGPTSTLDDAMLTGTAADPQIDRTPVIEYFVAVPTEAMPGDIIQFFWSTRNVTEAALWRVRADGSPGRAFPVEPEGQYSLPALAAGRDEEFVLSATNGHVTIEARVTVEVTCPVDFFFDPVPEETCPDAQAATGPAMFQAFEQGQMFWLQATNHVIILFTDVQRGTAGRPAWMRVVNPFFEGAAEEDPNLVPPEGLRQPRREFGMVWRDTPGVRERVGWALGDQQPFTTTTQSAEVGGGTIFYFSDTLGTVIALLPGGASWEIVSYNTR